MIVNKRAFAWEQDGKFYLSKLPPGKMIAPGKRNRPANQYDSRDALAVEARKRGQEVVWDNNTN